MFIPPGPRGSEAPRNVKRVSGYSEETRGPMSNSNGSKGEKSRVSKEDRSGSSGEGYSKVEGV